MDDYTQDTRILKNQQAVEVICIKLYDGACFQCFDTAGRPEEHPGL